MILSKKIELDKWSFKDKMIKKMFESLEKIFLKAVYLTSCLILFLPLFVYKKVVYPYIFSKVIVFQIIVEIIFAFWLILMVYKKEYRPNFKNPIVLTLTIFIAVLILTALTGVDPYRSFYSTQERMTGVLTMIHFWLWFLILITVLKNWEDWRKLIWVSLIFSFLVGLYGLGQKIGLKFLLQETDIRMSSTLGNPIYLGVYSMLHIFLAIFLFIKEKKFLKWLALFLTFFNLLVMIFSASRGVFLALFLSLFFFLIYLILSLPSKKSRVSFITIFILLIVIFGFFYYFFQTPKLTSIKSKMPFYLYRFLDFKTLTSSFDQRTIPWQIGLKGFKERPIFGWGWENFNVFFNKYFEPRIYRWGEEGTWFDKSHNQLIDILSLTGIIGLISYLFFFGTIFWLLSKKWLEKFEYTRTTRMGLFVLGLMFFAYFIQNLTVFDTPAPLIIFYFSLSLTYFITQNTDLNINKKIEKSKTNPRLKTQNLKQVPLPILIFLIIIFLSLALYEFNFKPFFASKEAIKGLAFSQVNPKIALDYFKKSLSKNTFINPEVRLLMMKNFVEKKEMIKDEKTWQEITEFLISEMKKNIKEHPNDVRYFIYLAQFYNFINQPDEAEEILIQAKKLSPKRQQIYFNLVDSKILKGEKEEAIKIAKQAVNLDPEVGEAHKILALTYFKNNDFKNGLLELEEAEKRIDIYTDTQTTLYIAISYFKAGNLKKAIEVSEIARSRDPKNVLVYTHLASLYKEAGEKEKAIEMAKKAVELDPSLAQEAEIFIKSLNQ